MLDSIVRCVLRSFFTCRWESCSCGLIDNNRQRSTGGGKATHLLLLVANLLLKLLDALPFAHNLSV